jgi:photosystem II stability/assembly factor-like uncharacterized protein
VSQQKTRKIFVITARRIIAVLAILGGAAVLITVPVSAQQEKDGFGSIDWAEPARLAVRSLLLDVTVNAARVIAVGERGCVLVSEDSGAAWNQAKVPTRSMLTAVTMVDDKNAWAVGHDAVIVHSSDGGHSWTRQFYAPEEERPLLDVWFENADHGIAVGAYGLFLETADGGTTWEHRSFDQEERHWNAVTRSLDGTLFVAAESGVVFRSRDRGKTWELLETPYKGSFFGGLALSDGSLLVFGLRGNVYRTADGGQTWQHIQTDRKISILNGYQCTDRTVVLVGLSGTILISQDNCTSFRSANRPDRKGLASVTQLNDKGLLLVGEAGITRGDDLLRSQSIPSK